MTDMMNALQGISIVAMLSLVVGVTPAFLGAAYAARPTEGKLALMRPFSLAGLFGALAGSTAGVINVLRMASMQGLSLDSKVPLMGFAEDLVPLFVAFGSLTVAWLLVALGLRRTAAGQ
jgi:hypothetical protein